MHTLDTVEVAGIELAYRVWGERAAPPVLLLAGLGGDGADWLGIAPELARTRCVYALDLRGHGASDWPGDYALERVSDDVAGFLGALGLTRASVVGHSYGGVVGYLLAQRHPALVERLVIEDAPPLWPQDPPLEVPERPEGRQAFDWAVKTQFTEQRNAPDPRWIDGLSAITAPTLLIGGGPDSHIPQELLADMAERIPDCRLVTIDAGHLVHETRPGEFLAEVRPFLEAGE
ncbi:MULTISPECIES: alpha/beta hydrolase [Streptomyces]|uniref:Alpha/beta hydrolase n=1 Tax=Streptomyces lonegramiae TaxID=3075524 RepID=A0ABU2XB89_9ACTN|nr:alpha/beta hydrolase [Streptomyces sp. DSM 41529]MDT0542741.1 alpha/beta hydrolase [Streptomyces sp. DSM 41529]